MEGGTLAREEGEQLGESRAPKLFIEVEERGWRTVRECIAVYVSFSLLTLSTRGGGAHIVFSFFGRDVTAKDKGCKNRDVIRSFLLSLALSLSCALHSPKSATAALSTFACK